MAALCTGADFERLAISPEWLGRLDAHSGGTAGGDCWVIEVLPLEHPRQPSRKLELADRADRDDIEQTIGGICRRADVHPSAEVAGVADCEHRQRTLDDLLLVTGFVAEDEPHLDGLETPDFAQRRNRVLG